MITRYKYKKDRSLLQNTFGSTKSSFNKKKYKPGMHKSTRPYETFYGQLLNQRQKLKAFYVNLKNRQLKSLIKKNINNIEYKATIILNLETRIDTILFRSGLMGFHEARQFINHRHVSYHGRPITSPSQKIKDHEPISFSNKGVEILKRKEFKSGRNSPTYIHVKHDTLEIIVNINEIPKKETELCFATKINLDQVIRSYRI